MNDDEANPTRPARPAVGGAPNTPNTAPNTAAEVPSSCADNRLRHGVVGGDPSKAPRCSAKTRSGTPCAGPAMRKKRRCRMHGGASTGLKSLEGKARAAHQRHGGHNAEMRALFAEARRLRAAAADLVAQHIERQRKRRATAATTTSNDGNPT